MANNRAERALAQAVALALEEQFTLWGTHPTYPVSAWTLAVENNTTRQGYWTWVAQEMKNIDEPCEDDDETEEPDDDPILAAHLGVMDAAGSGLMLTQLVDAVVGNSWVEMLPVDVQVGYEWGSWGTRRRLLAQPEQGVWICGEAVNE